MAQSRKRRKERQRAAAKPQPPGRCGQQRRPPDRNARLLPLAREGRGRPRGAHATRPGERPTAVTVGAIVAALLAAANLLAVIAGWDGAAGEDDRARAVAGSILVTGLLCVVAWGMWRAKYWAVLGMQTLLALTLIASALGLVTAGNRAPGSSSGSIIVGTGTLFWFMVKAMARIQMPERPTRAR